MKGCALGAGLALAGSLVSAHAADFYGPPLTVNQPLNAYSWAGPYLGGFLAQHFHWSAIFWINVPLGFLAFGLTNRLLRKLPRHDRPHRLDILGAALKKKAPAKKKSDE